MLRSARRHGEQYQAWEGFYENRETITFEQMRATRAVMGSPSECVDRIGALAEQYGLNSFIFEVNYGGLPTPKVLACLERFATEVVPQFPSA
jgi:alkanesulfonate monooxygenase SsuD/methylene tetrahydromethanopterin reductase-like flavin-dependent oxidoreductase (luciferase family)